ncbi:hypothetical protein GCM10010946_33390 [Undibacterium squillarum]|uniref:Uncharacterized protein n=2 Tax=Undibacterium squillarum TaxID=1131567 RepID=A0ABQ2Y325_9BURK|nr:hypothetical protein GCM10010946_33390 [Undibacterium squillarum]
MGYISPAFLRESFIQAILKLLVSTNVAIWGFAWLAYGKLSDTTDVTALDYMQHRRLDEIIRKKNERFWKSACILVIVAIVMVLPSIYADSAIDIPRITYGASFSAYAFALIFFFSSIRQLEEIREFKSKIKEQERQEKLRSEQLQKITSTDTKPWETDPNLNGFRKN